MREEKTKFGEDEEFLDIDKLDSMVNENEKTEVETEVVEEKKGSKTFIYIAAGITLVLIASAFAYTQDMMPFVNNDQKVLNQLELDSEFITLEEVERDDLIEGTLRRQYQPVRNYGFGEFKGKKFEINDIFQNLPPIPEDFFRYKYVIMSGRADSDMLCKMKYEYYAQPEFYSDTFTASGIKYYKSPNEFYWTPEGYGTFPHETEVVTFAGESFELCTFFHTSFGVETYQGFGLYVSTPDQVEYAENSRNIDTGLTHKYINASINPSTILLRPAYLRFDAEWTKKIVLKVNISDKTEPGLYAIGWDVGRAPLEYQSEWKGLYAEKFFTKSGIGPTEQQFIAKILVR